MNPAAAFVVGLVLGGALGELLAVGSLAAFHWAADKRDGALTDGSDG